MLAAIRDRFVMKLMKLKFRALHLHKPLQGSARWYVWAGWWRAFFLKKIKSKILAKIGCKLLFVCTLSSPLWHILVTLGGLGMPQGLGGGVKWKLSWRTTYFGNSEINACPCTYLQVLWICGWSSGVGIPPGTLVSAQSAGPVAIFWYEPVPWLQHWAQVDGGDHG